MKRLLAVGALAIVFGSASNDDLKAPDMSKVLALTGRFSSAHGCPVASGLMITAAHVFDIRPEDKDYPMLPYRGENATWRGGLRPVGELWDADAAFGEPSTPFESWYQVGAKQPEPGTVLYWLAYDFRDKNRAFASRILHGKVIRVVAGTILVDTVTYPGSSGSCVLNSDGQVVGLVVATFELDHDDKVTIITSVTSDWLKVPEARKE